MYGLFRIVSNIGKVRKFLVSPRCRGGRDLWDFLNRAWNLTRKFSLRDKVSGEKFELRVIGLEDRVATGSRISYRVWIPGNMLANAKRGGFLREYEYSDPQREE